MNTLFISDLHLSADHPEIAKVFLNFLQHKMDQTEAIYILGDLFETWIGDDDLTTFNQTIIQTLKKITAQGIPVYFMHGNRDFLIGQRFMQMTGCQLLQDPTLIHLYGIPTLLMHGDTLCIDDIAYLRYRKTTHHPLPQTIFLKLPLFLRKKVTALLRKQTQKQAKHKHTDIMDANLEEAKRVMQQYDAQLLIHGHTHRPSIQYFKLENNLACRIVLSDWHEQGNALICSSNGEWRLTNFL